MKHTTAHIPSLPGITDSVTMVMMHGNDAQPHIYHTDIPSLPSITDRVTM